MSYIVSKPLPLSSKDLLRLVLLYRVLKKYDVWTVSPKYRLESNNQFVAYNEIKQ